MPGILPQEILEGLMAALPVDITFADKDDIIRYYSDYRIFKRTPEILGTSVLNCHSPASRQRVKEVLDDLRSGRRDMLLIPAEKDGRQVSVRYIAVRGNNGDYQGLVEVAEWVAEAPRAC